MFVNLAYSATMCSLDSQREPPGRRAACQPHGVLRVALPAWSPWRKWPVRGWASRKKACISCADPRFRMQPA